MIVFKHIYFWSVVLFGAFIVPFLSSCEKGTDSLADSKPLTAVEARTTVNFIGHWYNEGKREELVRNFTREYELKNQQVSINLKFPEEVYYNREDLRSNQKFVAKVLLQDKPEWDIVRLNGEYMEITEHIGDPDWPRKYLVDFSEIEEFRKGTLPELLSSEAKKAWNGIIPGPYIEGQFWALWCNKKVAEKVGIEVKQMGMTFDDFKGYLKAVNEYNLKNPQNYITPIYESVDWPTTMVIAVQLYASLLKSKEEFFIEKITENRLLAWKKTLEALEELSKYNPINPNWQKVNWGKTTASLINEECLFYVNGSWMYNIWLGIDKDKIQNCMPTEFPTLGKQTVYPGGYQVMWGVLKNAPHRDEAVKFLLAMNKPSMSEMWVRYTKCPTGIKGNLTGVSFGKDQFENFSFHIQEDYKTNSYRFSESSIWMLDKQHEKTRVFYSEVMQGKMTADQAFSQLKQSIGH